MWHVYINRELTGRIKAASYTQARRIAKKRFGVSCDVIGERQ